MKKGVKGVSIKEDKIKLVGELREKFAKSKLAILTNFAGLNVEQMNQLRRKLDGASAEVKVIKNTLAKIASKQTPFEILYGFFEGPTSITFGWQNPAVTTKILIDFAKNQPNLEIKAAILEGKLLLLDRLQRFASLPPKEILLSQALSGMQAPLVTLVGTVGGILRNLLGVLEAIKEKRSSAAGAIS